MLRLVIDSKAVEAQEGATILDAAQGAGIDIPTLCHRRGLAPSASCMVCVVRVLNNNRLVPACATLAEDSMAIDTASKEVQEARRRNLELLLSEHSGDCEGPCTLACPALPDTPAMLRMLQRADLAGAAALARQSLVLPVMLGFICPAPCEKICRRGSCDAPVAIRNLHRYAGCKTLRAASAPGARLAPATSVAVVGAGPAGLAAAATLARAGIGCTLYDAAATPGGGLCACVANGSLPQQVLADECQAILADVPFVPGFCLRDADGLHSLLARHAAVILALGSQRPLPDLGLAMSASGIAQQAAGFRTSQPGVYAAGGAVRPIRRLAVRAIAQGRDAAWQIAADLRVWAPPQKIAWRMRRGKMSAADLAALCKSANTQGRVPDPAENWTDKTAQREAGRCLHCDCSAKQTCGLRLLADRHGASAARYGKRHEKAEIDASHPQVIFEPGKCIRCGLCVEVSRQAKERLGLAWQGRGLAMQPAGALGKPLAEALASAATACAAICPTGALHLRQDYQTG